MTRASPWGLLVGVLLLVGAEIAVFVIPPSKGIKALVRYEGGLTLLLAEGKINPLPWEAISGCVF